MNAAKAGQDTNAGRRLVVCVDDFGLNVAVDGSVIALARAGRISATGVLVDAPRWPTDASRLAQEAGDRLDVGLHLNLSESFPSRPAMHDWSGLVLRAYAGGLQREALRAEVDRQLDAFERAWGRAPDFVDGHRHVHQLPVVRDALIAAMLARYAAGRRPWLRCTLAAPGGAPTAGDAFKAAVIGALGGRALQNRARREGLATNRRMLGVYGFQGTPAEHERRLAGWLKAAGDGDLLMCHTALAGPGTAGDPIAGARQVEHAVLAGGAFSRLLDEGQVRITRGPRG